MKYKLAKRKVIGKWFVIEKKCINVLVCGLQVVFDPNLTQ